MGWLDERFNEVKDGVGNLARQAQIPTSTSELTDFYRRNYTSIANLHPLGREITQRLNPPPDEPPPGEDPRITKQRNSLLGEANKFREGLQGYKNSRYGDVANTARDQLDQTTQGIRRNANARGLLFSGLRAGAEANSRTKMASMLASQRAEINKEADDLAQSKDTAAANVGLSGYEDAIKRSQDLYNLESTNQARRRAALGQLGEGVGYGLGAYYSTKKPTQSSGLIGNSTGQSYRDYSGYV
jgi:hypothetical protein